MEKEQVAVDEAVETVAEENTRAYSKTVWNESTPITADKLNKIEDGIASALPISGGTLTGKIDVPGESTFYKGTYVDPWENTGCVIKASGDVGIGGSLKVNDRLAVLNMIESPTLVASADLIVDRYGFKTFYTNSEEGAFIFCNKNGSSITLKDNRMVYANPQGNLEIGPRNSYHCHFFTDRPAIQFNKDLFVNENKVYHEGNKPTAAAIGALPLAGGTLSGNISVPGESRFYNDAYTDPWVGQACAIKASGHVGIGGSLKVNEKLAFSNIGTGGGLNANIHNLALHNQTGNGQMMTADVNRIYVGNPQTPLTIESSSNPIVNIGGNTHQLYHTGNLSVGNFVSGANGTGTTTLGNFNSAWKSGFYEGNGASNQPFSEWCWMIHAGHTSNNSGGAYNYGMQIAGQNGTNNFAMRTVNANGYGTWNTLYHTGNKPTAGDIGALPLSGGIMNGTLSMEYGGHPRRRIAAIASHGGTDLGDNNSRTTIQSNQVPTWWNGNKNRAMLVFDTDNPSDYIVRCGAGLGGAAGYITFSW